MLRGFVLTRSFASTRHMRTGGDGSKGGMVLRGRNSLLGLENSLICGGETWLTAERQIHCHQQEHIRSAKEGKVEVGELPERSALQQGSVNLT